MNQPKSDDKLFWDSETDSEPVIRLVFDNPSSQIKPLFGSEPLSEPSSVIKLFPDDSDFANSPDTNLDVSQPIVRLLPDSPSEEAVLRLRCQLLEAKLARQNAQIDFSERIDVDHMEWRNLQFKIQNLQMGNILLIFLTIALMICAGCLAVIR